MTKRQVRSEAGKQIFGRDGLYEVEGSGQSVWTAIKLLLVALIMLCFMSTSGVFALAWVMSYNEGWEIGDFKPAFIAVPLTLMIIFIAQPVFSACRKSAMSIIESVTRIATLRADFLETLIETDIEEYAQTRRIPVNNQDDDLLLDFGAKPEYKTPEIPLQTKEGKTVLIPEDRLEWFLEKTVKYQMAYNREKWVGGKDGYLTRPQYEAIMHLCIDRGIFQGRTQGFEGKLLIEDYEKARQLCGLI